MASQLNLYNSMEFINTAERAAFITHSFMASSPIRPNGLEIAEQTGMTKDGANKVLAIVSGMCPPPSTLEEKLTAREKVAYLTYTIMSGSPITPSAIALKLNTTVRTIERTMEKMSFSLPIVKNARKWFMFTY
jgi:hypothetical protein